MSKRQIAGIIVKRIHHPSFKLTPTSTDFKWRAQALYVDGGVAGEGTSTSYVAAANKAVRSFDMTIRRDFHQEEINDDEIHFVPLY